MIITGNAGRTLASAKTPRPLNIGIRKSEITRSKRFSESASFGATAARVREASDLHAFTDKHFSHCPEHSRIVIYYQNRFVLQLVHNVFMRPSLARGS